MIGENFIRKASGFYAPPLIGLAGKWKLQACGVGNCCSAVPCADCIGGTIPQEFEATFAGTTEWDCGNCDTYNATYIVPIFSPCLWFKEGNTNGICDTDFSRRVGIQISDSNLVTVSYSTKFKPLGRPRNYWVFQRVYADGIPCNTMSDDDIPLAVFYVAEIPYRCYGQSTTCKLTAL